MIFNAIITKIITVLTCIVYNKNAFTCHQNYVRKHLPKNGYPKLTNDILEYRMVQIKLKPYWDHRRDRLDIDYIVDEFLSCRGTGDEKNGHNIK